MKTTEYTSPVQDFSRGVVSGVVDRKRGRPNWLKDAENLYGRPLGAASIRPGSRDLSDATLPEASHSLLKYYASGGGGLFVAAGTHIYLVTTTGYPLVILPITPSTNEWSHDNLNGVMIATQRLTPGNLPLIYDGTTWMSLKPPVPANSLTLTPGIGAGSMTPNVTYYYRLRWLFKNGASKSSTPQSVAMGVGDNQVAITTIPISPSPARSDYLGWRLERTEAGATSAGPYYFVADGTAANYTDQTSDSNLDYQADEGLHGDPPPMDGVIAFANRLIGWYGSALYPSQSPGDLEATGICNYDPELTVYAAKDDGDTIQLCVVVGDELLILKRRSVWRLTGTGPENFQLVPVVAGSGARGGEAGAVGPRAACAIGNAAFFWGDGGIFRYAAGRVDPAGWIEMGKYMTGVNKAVQDRIVMVNQIGDFVLIFNPQSPYDYNSHCLLYDARINQWWPWRGWFARDAIVVKDGSLGDATLVFCDSRTAEASGVFETRSSSVAFAQSSFHTYAVSPDPNGTQQWAANGINIDNGASTPSFSRLSQCTDGSSGFYYAYNEDNGGGERVMVRHVDSTGATMAGFPVAVHPPAGAGRFIDDLKIVPDWQGGAYCVYSERIGGTTTGPMCRRVNGDGTFAWAEQVLAGNRCFYLSILGLSLNAGGDLIIGGADFGSTSTSRWFRIDRATGAVTWDVTKAGLNMSGDGYCIENEDFNIWYKRSNDSHCALIKLSDGSTITPGAQTSTATGTGLSIAVASAACSDGVGGLFCMIAGTKTSPSGDYGIWVRRIDKLGNLLWSSAVEITDDPQYRPNGIGGVACIPDGEFGCICLSFMFRTAGTPIRSHVDAVRLDANGNRVWGSSAIRVAAYEAVNGINKGGACTDGAGGAVMVWQDGRNGSNRMCYGARILSDGSLPWTADGVQLSNRTGIAFQIDPIVFAGAPVGGLPSGSGSGYHVWVGFDGFKDEKDRLRAGGNAVPWLALTPMIDDSDKLGVASNQPKEFGRLQSYINTNPSQVSAAIILEPGSRVVAIPLDVGIGGAEWGDDTATIGDDDGVWDESDWGQDEQAPVTSAFPVGTIGSRYAMQYSGAAEDDMQFQGFELDAVLTPERRIDQ